MSEGIAATVVLRGVGEAEVEDSLWKSVIDSIYVCLLIAAFLAATLYSTVQLCSLLDPYKETAVVVTTEATTSKTLSANKLHDE